MKNLAVVGFILLLAGCSSQSFPVTSDTKTWHDFGYQQGFEGLVKSSEPEITAEVSAEVTDTIYQSYSQGYDAGKTAYCAQDAFELGLMQKPYYGVCDSAFRAAYQRGMWEDDFRNASYLSESDYD